MTSSIFSPRRLRALCSPSTQVMASATLLFPQPFGPTMAVTPSSKASSERSENDLNPEISRRSRRILVVAKNLTRPSHCGKAKLTPLYFGLGTQTAGMVSLGGQRPPGLPCGAPLRSGLAHLEKLLCFRKERQRELQLRVAGRQVAARRLDAEQIDVDFVPQHRSDELDVLLPRILVDLQPGAAHIL